MPPKDVYDGEHLWFLLKAMNGTREASRQWGLYIKGSIGPHGFLASAAIPGLFYHPEWDIMMACHGDDFLAEGLAEDLDKLDEVMKANFEVKILPRIGDPNHGGEVAEGQHLQDHQMGQQRFQLAGRSEVCHPTSKRYQLGYVKRS